MSTFFTTKPSVIGATNFGLGALSAERYADGTNAQGYRRLKPRKPCFCAHVPYNRNIAPFAFMRLVPCAMCRRKWVPEFILTSVEPPSGLPVCGDGSLVEATVCRARRSGVGEQDAVRISEVLPFVEYDIQRQLMLKLKLVGANAAFNYRSSVKISDSMILATATVTAVYLKALPPPAPIQITLQQMKDMRLDQDAYRRVESIQRDIEILYKAMKTVRARDISLSLSNQSRSSSSSSSSSSGGSSSGSSSSSSSSSYSSSEEDDVESVSLSRPSSSSSESSSSGTESIVAAKPEEAADARFHPNDIEAGSQETLSGMPVSRRRSHSNSSEAVSTSVRSSDKMRDKGSGFKGGSRRTRAGSITTNASQKRSVKTTTRGVFVDDRPPYVLEVDEETDIDLLASLADKRAPFGMAIVNTEVVPTIPLMRSGGEWCGTERSVDERADDCNLSTDDVAFALLPHVVLPAINMVDLQRKAKSLCAVRRARLTHKLRTQGNASLLLQNLFQAAYSRLCFSVRKLMPCHIVGLNHHINVTADNTIELMIFAMCHSIAVPPPHLKVNKGVFTDITGLPNSLLPESIQYVSAKRNEERLQAPLLLPPSILVEHASNGKHYTQVKESDIPRSNPSLRQTTAVSMESIASLPVEAVAHPFPGRATTVGDFRPSGSNEKTAMTAKRVVPIKGNSRSLTPVVSETLVFLTPLSSIPGTKVKRYLGPIQLHFIKESWALRSEGSHGAFIYSYLMDANAAVRAHVLALGGNALLCHRIVQLESAGGSSGGRNAARSQVYNMISVTGDAVIVDFVSEASSNSQVFLDSASHIQEHE